MSLTSTLELHTTLQSWPSMKLVILRKAMLLHSGQWKKVTQLLSLFVTASISNYFSYTQFLQALHRMLMPL